ncbi:sensor histidine kinase [Gordonia sp. NPDC003376]
MRPEDYQPRLTRWGHLWRLLLMLVISAIATTGRLEYQIEHARWWLAIDVLLGVAGLVAVWWRRAHPVVVCTFTAVASLVSITVSGPAALALVSLSTRRRWREIVPQAVLGIGAGVLAERIVPGPTPSSEPMFLIVVLTVAIVGALIAWGLYIGSRRELLASWRSRAMLAEQEQQAKISQARSVERARIAREMHDVLAHRISTVSMYAGALAFRDDLSAQEVTQTARTIEENSRLALTELREVLGVLREGPGDADPELPQVRPADIEALIEENRDAGMRIGYTLSADLDAVSASTVRTLYRCVQEGLTNARKHAPAATVTVRIEPARASGIDLLVVNPLPIGDARSVLPPSGLGLIGLGERVALSGGRHSVTRTDDAMFILHVWLPGQE